MESSELTDLLDDGDLFEVQDHDHPEFGWYVSFDDEVAREHDDALDAMVEEISELPGVRGAVREDREVVLLAATLDVAALEAWLDRWWRDRAAES